MLLTSKRTLRQPLADNLGGFEMAVCWLSGSTLTVTCGPFIPASGGRMWDNNCSALQERTEPFELV